MRQPSVAPTPLQLLTAPRAAAPGAAAVHDASRLRTMGAVLLISAAALLIRLVHLGQPSLWVDEIYSVQYAIDMAGGDFRGSRFMADVLTLAWFQVNGFDLTGLAADRIWEWQAAGLNERFMRLPFAVLGALTILVVGWTSRSILGSRPAILLCLFLALSPWHLWMSQVCRFYIQLFLLYNLALLLYYQATERDQLWKAVAATVCMVLAFYTTPIAIMIMAVFGVDILANLLRRRPTGMRLSFWAVGLAGLAVCGAAILFKVSAEGGYSSSLGTRQPFMVLVLGMVYMIGVPFVVVSLLGIWSLLSQGRERLAVLLTAAAIVPPIAFLVLNVFGLNTHVRYTFVALFPWLALAAFGTEAIVAALEQRFASIVAWIPVAALLGTFALLDYVYMTSGHGFRAQWRTAAAYVEQHRRPGEPVAGDFSARRAAMFYLHDPEVTLIPRAGVTAEELRALLPTPTWIIISAYRPSVGERSGWLDVAGDLRAYFVNRGAEPAHAINVYYYDPTQSAGEGESPSQ